MSTAPMPPDVLARSFTFGPGMSPQRQASFLAAVHAARPEAQGMIDQLDGFTTVGVVDRVGPGELGEASYVPGGYAVTIARRVFRRSRLDRAEVILHELGHLVQFSGLDATTAAALDALIPRRGTCRPRPGRIPRGPCAPAAERFADTFGKWALGVRRFRRVGYNVPAPRTWTSFAQALVDGYAFRYRPG